VAAGCDISAAHLPPMAKTSTLSTLLRAVSRRDLAEARRVAEVLVEEERLAGRHGAAARLRGALAETGPVPHSATDQRVSSVALHDLITPLPPARLEDVELPARERSKLADLIAENQQRALLEAHGLKPRKRLFLGGPPGTGKTLTARALATALGWPAYVVRFDSLLGAFLGQTSVRVREVFRFAESTAAVLVLDEIDAIGRVRGRAADIGELDRVVISLMQQLDLAQPAGLIVAASNLPTAIDPALLRRFDLHIAFRQPTKAQLHRFATHSAAARGVTIKNGARTELAAARTYADAVGLVEAELRRAVLAGK
jgi:SpoVK/Ycf46/Vps4 family AAA+-type ATPase